MTGKEFLVLCVVVASGHGKQDKQFDEDQRNISKQNDKHSYSNVTGVKPEEIVHLLEGYKELLISMNETHNVSVHHICSRKLERAREEMCNLMLTPIPVPVRPSSKPSPLEVWGFGIAFVTLINLSSVLGVVFLPLMNKKFYKKLLTVMVGLAVGSLSASAVFHLIPQALQLVDGPSHAYLNVTLMVWVGVWVFFMVERVLRIVVNRRSFAGRAALPGKDLSATSTSTEGPSEGDEAIAAAFAHASAQHHHHSHSAVPFRARKDSAIATVAWMVVFGDGFHNFIDGLSLGAAFSESALTGASIGTAVLCEELPHELGDFAVLLAAGMSVRQALVANVLSACTCYAGLVLGILLGEFHAGVYVFGFAAGMFLYISLVDMMPELNAAAEEAAKRSTSEALTTLLLQNVGLISGGGLLFCLANFQDRIQF